MSLLKDALTTAAKFVSERVAKPQSYLMIEDENGEPTYKPLGALYTPQNPPPASLGAPTSKEKAVKAARFTI